MINLPIVQADMSGGNVATVNDASAQPVCVGVDMSQQLSSGGGSDQDALRRAVGADLVLISAHSHLCVCVCVCVWGYDAW